MRQGGSWIARWLDLGFRKENLDLPSGGNKTLRWGVVATAAAIVLIGITVLRFGTNRAAIPQWQGGPLARYGEVDSITAARLELVERVQSLEATKARLESEWNAINARDSTAYSAERAALEAKIRTVKDSLADLQTAMLAVGVHLDTLTGEGIGATSERTAPSWIAPWMWLVLGQWDADVERSIGDALEHLHLGAMRSRDPPPALHLARHV